MKNFIPNTSMQGVTMKDSNTYLRGWIRSDHGTNIKIKLKSLICKLFGSAS